MWQVGGTGRAMFVFPVSLASGTSLRGQNAQPAHRETERIGSPRPLGMLFIPFYHVNSIFIMIKDQTTEITTRTTTPSMSEMTFQA